MNKGKRKQNSSAHQTTRDCSTEKTNTGEKKEENIRNNNTDIVLDGSFYEKKKNPWLNIDINIE